MRIPYGIRQGGGMNYKAKQILGGLVLALGVISVLCFLPFWVWSFVVGIALIVVGIVLLKSC